MARLVVLLVSFLAVTCLASECNSTEKPNTSTTPQPSTTTEKTCPDGEVLDDCPADCPADYCPKKESDNKSCPNPKQCPAPKCKCGFNRRRAENGTCISTRDCPPFKCPKKEEYNPCPPLCPNGGCSQATPTGNCPAIFGHIGIVLECNPACRCIKGYWRLNGTCVPYDQCPGKSNSTGTEVIEEPSNSKTEPSTETPTIAAATESTHVETSNDNGNATDGGVTSSTCGPNEVWSNVTCPPDTCASIGARYNCPLMPSADYKCVCKSGTYRMKENTPCVAQCECPQLQNSDECAGTTCGPNEVWTNMTCPPDTCDSIGHIYNCPKMPASVYKCVCKSGTYRLETNTPCVPESKCPKTSDNQT